MSTREQERKSEPQPELGPERPVTKSGVSERGKTSRARRKVEARGMNKVTRSRLIEQRKRLLDELFGIDKGRIKPFVEADRGEDRR